MENEALISQAMLVFIDKFIERQELVLEVMCDTWPHLLIITGQEGDRSTFREALKRRDYIPQSGMWGENQEWYYFVHGTGCGLRHVETGEPIEWGGGQVEAWVKIFPVPSNNLSRSSTVYGRFYKISGYVPQWKVSR